MGLTADMGLRRSLSWKGVRDWIAAAIRGFEEPVKATIIVASASLLTLLLQTVNSGATAPLASSLRTPWGVVTAIVVHRDAVHFAVNVIGLAMLTLFFIVTNAHHGLECRRDRSRCYVLGSLLVAVTTNAAWAIGVPGSRTVGASGVAYAALGIVMGYALVNLFTPRRLPMSARAYYANPRVLRSLAYNLAVFGVFFLSTQTDPAGFLSVGPGVNVFAHGISFFPAFLVTLGIGVVDRPTPSLPEAQAAPPEGAVAAAK